MESKEQKETHRSGKRLNIDRREGIGRLSEKVRSLRSIDWQLQNSHGDVKYSMGNIVNNTVITMYGASKILEKSWRTLCKYDYLTRVLYV